MKKEYLEILKKKYFFYKNKWNNKINRNGDNSINFIKSSFFALFSSIILLSGVISLVDATIKDGSAYDNSRWGRLGEAYQTINESENESIIFIGSSVSYFGIDGKCIEDNDKSDYNYYNLAVRGDMPYLRILETEYIIDSGPKKIIIEAGPNTFQKGIGSVEERLRWQIFSLYNDIEKEKIEHLIIEMDNKYILDNEIDRLYFKQKTTGIGLDEVLRNFLRNNDDNSGDGHLPSKDSHKWEDSLKTPPVSDREPLTDLEWFEYVERLSNSEFWIPESDKNLNRMAFDYMIEEFSNNGIEVILLSLPIHNDLKNSIPNGSWDAFNDTRNELQKNHTFLDYTWENWDQSYFIDPIHLSSEGRQKMCNELISNMNH
ncbi:MAG: hypothetical protein CMD13_00195 [Flavobacteriales bacterium]|nr:hypothetical protein [Flavobacteriales bacterium]|tara:strand:- start:5113 stop:6231 length:1119 start_codon:yes stop_codon:yes gene_type:complete